MIGLKSFIIASIVSALVWLGALIWQEIKGRLICSIRTDSHDALYVKLLRYLTERGHIRPSTSSMEVKLKANEYGEDSWARAAKGAKDGVTKPQVEYLPGGGRHFFTYEGAKLCATIGKGEPQRRGAEGNPTPADTLHISRCSGADPAPLKNLVQAAIDFAEAEDEEAGLTKVFRVGHCGLLGWEECHRIKAPALESVVLDGTIAQDIVADIKRFQQAAQWYSEKGVPYRRGYLLHGPPGTGKRSLT